MTRPHFAAPADADQAVCAGLTLRGTRCTRKHKPGDQFCGHHSVITPRSPRGSKQKASCCESGCTRPRVDPFMHCRQHISLIAEMSSLVLSSVPVVPATPPALDDDVSVDNDDIVPESLPIQPAPCDHADVGVQTTVPAIMSIGVQTNPAAPTCDAAVQARLSAPVAELQRLFEIDLQDPSCDATPDDVKAITTITESLRDGFYETYQADIEQRYMEKLQTIKATYQKQLTRAETVAMENRDRAIEAEKQLLGIRLQLEQEYTEKLAAAQRKFNEDIAAIVSTLTQPQEPQPLEQPQPQEPMFDPNLLMLSMTPLNYFQPVTPQNDFT